jgi:hypothetical protein
MGFADMGVLAYRLLGWISVSNTPLACLIVPKQQSLGLDGHLNTANYA